MEYTHEQNSMIKKVIELLSNGNENIKNSASTKVMAINLLDSFGWDIDKAIHSLR